MTKNHHNYSVPENPELTAAANTAIKDLHMIADSYDAMRSPPDFIRVHQSKYNSIAREVVKGRRPAGVVATTRVSGKSQKTQVLSMAYRGYKLKFYE